MRKNIGLSTTYTECDPDDQLAQLRCSRHCCQPDQPRNSWCKRVEKRGQRWKFCCRLWKPQSLWKIVNNTYSVSNPDKTGINSVFSNYANASPESLKEIHEKYGHTSIQRINALIPSNLSKEEKANFNCKLCILSKIIKHATSWWCGKKNGLSR